MTQLSLDFLNENTYGFWIPQITKEEYELWETMKTLGPKEDLPASMPELFYFRPSSILQCGQYATLVEPYMRHFPPEK